MSNYLAIATVTAVLKELVDKSLRASGAVAGSGATFTVTTVRPSDRTNVTKRGVNIFLHHVTPNAHWRNVDLPTRRERGATIHRPAAAIDLHYVLTFYGEESLWEPQRYFGVVLRTLHSHATLSRELVKTAIDAIGGVANFAFIRTSDLARAIEQVRFTPDTLSLDELSKIWSSFYQTEYALSTVYVASPVLVEAEDIAQEALPVRSTSVRALPFSQPVIDHVRRTNGEPITAGAAIRVEGSNLRGDFTQLLLDDAAYTGSLDVNHDVVSATLPATMYAGVHQAQIVHMVALGRPSMPHRGVESNVAPFMLHPIAGAPTIAGRTARVVAGRTLVSGTMTIPLTPRIERTQRVLLLLNNVSTADNTAYTFAAEPRPDGPANPTDTPSVDVKLIEVLAGTYYLRAQVAGAMSVPSLGPEYPMVAIT